MAKNIEWKAKAQDVHRQLRLAAKLADGPPEVLEQVDTFFPVTHGYLKLRQFSADRGELIQYLRPVQVGPRLSKYSLLPIDQPEVLRELLIQALGIYGEVRKRRTLYMVGQSRIHLDEVAHLGNFVEVEVVLRPEQTNAEGERIASTLRRQLEVRDEDLIDVAYIELLRQLDDHFGNVSRMP